MRQTIDLLILDFSKAFDTVPHRRLLHKIQHYGVEGLCYVIYVEQKHQGTQYRALGDT
jgi:hypothetical protein